MKMGQLSTTKHKTGTEIRRDRTEKQTSDRRVLKHWWRLTDGHWGSWVGVTPDVSLLLLGEFHSVAEDLDSRLFKTESRCLGRLTVDTEHLPKKPRERHNCSHRSHGWEEEREGLWRRASRSDEETKAQHSHGLVCPFQTRPCPFWAHTVITHTAVWNSTPYVPWQTALVCVYASKLQH